MIGLTITGLLVLAAAIGPVVYGVDPLEQDLMNRLALPSITKLLGTDEVGRDILSRIIHGARISMVIGVVSVSIGMSIGGPLGLLSGYYGGLVDDGIMRLLDILMAFPGILLAIVVTSILGPGLFNVMIAVGIGSAPVFARVIRSSVLSIKTTEYVMAARAVGQSDTKIMWRHVLPNCLFPLLILVNFRVATAILTSAGLSFLGLGAQPPIPEWGAMLNASRTYIRVAWWVGMFPGLAITLAVIGLNLVGDGMRDVFDPRLRQ